MRSLDVLGIGLLILISNLVLCAVLAPTFSFGNGSPGLRLRKTLRILTLALVQIGAWALMFHEGGASPTPEAAGEEALRLFTFMGRSAEGLVGPWSALVPFVSLNGLLFLPISLISGFTTEVKVVSAPVEAKPAELASKAAAPLVEEYEVEQQTFEEEAIPPLLPVQKAAQESVKSSEPAVNTVQKATPAAPAPPAVPVPPVQVAKPKPAPAQTPAVATPAPVAPVTAHQAPRRGEPFRGSLPPIQLHPQPQAELEVPTFSPDRPPERIPPTPPPIRFT